MGRKLRILLTGATGFVGAHTYPTLVARGFDVLCGTRDPVRASQHEPLRRFCRLDLGDRPLVEAALAEVDAAVYLVHSMGQGPAYAAKERAHATIFREAAEKRGLERIVYLGGMRPRGEVSRHLSSRLRTGQILRAGLVPAVELQATMIIGGGSESFRIVRDLAARLPFMVLPKWLANMSEPVAIADVAEAIAFAITMPLAPRAEKTRVYSLPGPERLSGRDILVRTARLLGQRPVALSVPVVTPRLSSYWIRLVTRADPEVATELVEGLRSDIVAVAPPIWREMGRFRRTSFDDAVRAALGEEDRRLGPTTRAVERALHQLSRA